MTQIQQSAHEAKQASIQLAALDSVVKNQALQAIADKLAAHASAIVEANKKDMDRSTQQNLAAPLLKRLKFDESKIQETIAGIKSLIANAIFACLCASKPAPPGGRPPRVKAKLFSLVIGWYIKL